LLLWSLKFWQKYEKLSLSLPIFSEWIIKYESETISYIWTIFDKCSENIILYYSLYFIL
jgi:hypothetical protein